MPVLHVDRHEADYTVVSNQAIEDSRLSFRARGVLIWLLAKPEGWVVSKSAIANAGSESAHAIDAVFTELYSLGYLTQSHEHRTDGKLAGTVITVHERPGHDTPTSPRLGEVTHSSPPAETPQTPSVPRESTLTRPRETAPLVSTHSELSTNTEVSTSHTAKSRCDAERFPPEVSALCERLADAIRENGGIAPKPMSIGWLDAMDRLIRLDRRPPAEIAKVIDWCQQDDFWRGNVLSAPKLRAKYDQLRLKMQARPRNGHGSPTVKQQMLEALERRGTKVAGHG
jgi:hypothetical protein